MDILELVVAGFIAQAIDGALGMAYGVTCSSLLLAFGYSPLASSAAVHLAEVVTSGVSGHFHRRFGNVDTELFQRLLWPGIAGGALGASVLSTIPTGTLRPLVSAYLLLMGCRIIYQAARQQRTNRSGARIEVIGFAGGLFDAVGGGGWGPIVTSALVGRGHDPRMAIGSANRAEFFVTVVQSLIFTVTIGFANWQTAAALCVGGAFAAPFAAHSTRLLPPRLLMLAVGVLVTALSLRTLWLAS